MPPQLQALLQNRNALIAIIAGVVVVVIVVTVMAVQGGNTDPADKPLPDDKLRLAQVAGYGKAIEIQALLARQNLQVSYDDTEGESKIKIKFEKGAKFRDRDKALITLVQSGLMDKNVGLEAFDKGDLTASREEKRIKLVRSQQGELARLIKKIDPIEDASVNIAIPEQTLFRSDEKPMSASVQVTLPVDSMLTNNQVRAISNLMVGSIQGLGTGHLAISDTNGNTYNSVLDSGTEMEGKLEAKDSYMKQKVAAQLDRLVGAGNYVVTVSTQLRQAPKEMTVQQFDPQGAVVSSKQAFNENLNSGGGLGAGGPVSSMLPNGLSASLSGGGGGKDYLRNGVEVTYNNSKTQWTEMRPVGMIEDISIAVTIDANHFPEMGVNELQSLLAHAASPQVRPESVSIAKSSLQALNPISNASGMDHSSGKMDFGWLVWVGGGGLALLFLMILFSVLGKGGGSRVSDEEFQETHRELAQLRDLAYQQQAQLQATQQQTQILLENQQRVQQPAPSMASPVADMNRQITGSGLEETLAPTLAELRDVVSNEPLDDEDLSLQIKSWIESS